MQKAKDRRAVTRFLRELLIQDRLTGLGKYWSSEVTLDYGTQNVKRVDFMQFVAENTSVSGIEHGIFVSYEIKSCKEDYNSGFGMTFETEKGYVVVTMETYKEILGDIHHLPRNVGVMVAIPRSRAAEDEFESPTPIDQEQRWRLEIIKPAHIVSRKRSVIELLFCMLRSGKD